MEGLFGEMEMYKQNGRWCWALDMEKARSKIEWAEYQRKASIINFFQKEKKRGKVRERGRAGRRRYLNLGEGA